MTRPMMNGHVTHGIVGGLCQPINNAPRLRSRPNTWSRVAACVFFRIISPRCSPCSASLRWCWRASRRRSWMCCFLDCVWRDGTEKRTSFWHQFLGNTLVVDSHSKTAPECRFLSSLVDFAALTRSSRASSCGWQSCWRWAPSYRRHSENMPYASSVGEKKTISQYFIGLLQLNLKFKMGYHVEMEHLI